MYAVLHNFKIFETLSRSNIIFQSLIHHKHSFYHHCTFNIIKNEQVLRQFQFFNTPNRRHLYNFQSRNNLSRCSIDLIYTWLLQTNNGNTEKKNVILYAARIQLYCIPKRLCLTLLPNYSWKEHLLMKYTYAQVFVKLCVC